MRIHIKQKVMTPDGPGIVVKKEYEGEKNYRVSIKNCSFPRHRPRMYTDDILYYFIREISIIKQINNLYTANVCSIGGIEDEKIS